ncbi:MAG: hypothetical protein CMJ96_08705 [Planctomycetes bacterium]|nr:hypothetical protein [Planctomycetota bacterium]
MNPLNLDLSTPLGREEAATLLQKGQILALPTDTVPGLGVLLGAEDAASRLASCKSAPSSRPFSLHFGALNQLNACLPKLPAGLPAWINSRLPGPWTLVLPSAWVEAPWKETWPHEMTGFRVPREPLFSQLASSLDSPLLMTSINESGEPPLWGPDLETWLEQHPEVVPAINPRMVQESQASRVVSFTPTPQILRGAPLSKGELPGKSVLILCTGNICRSPLAAEALRVSLAASWDVSVQELSSLGWVVESAGTFATPGLPATAHSIQVAKEVGLDLSRHQAQFLGDALAKPWDLVLGLGKSHLDGLSSNFSAELDVLNPRGQDIADPYGGSLAIYRQMRDEVLLCIEDRMATWSSWGARKT